MTNENAVVMNGTVALGDKTQRLQHRQVIEDFQLAIQEAVGSQHGDRDTINDKGLSEYITGGAYTRVVNIPKDTLLVSELWSKQRLWIIIEGSVEISSERGRETITAPYVGVAPFGSKVAIYTLEDTLWAAITGVAAECIDDVPAEIKVQDYNDISYEWDLLEGDIE